MITIKNGVRLHGVCPQMFFAAGVYETLWTQNDYPACITSGIEGRHKRDSEHWEGDALDFRTWLDGTGKQMPKSLRQSMGKELQSRLGEEFVVIVEGDHIHCHYRSLKAS